MKRVIIRQELGEEKEKKERKEIVKEEGKFPAKSLLQRNESIRIKRKLEKLTAFSFGDKDSDIMFLDSVENFG